MIDHPTISVIIPLYNMAESLSETLASCRAQDYTEYEIIVVDDGSTDDSAAIATELLATMSCRSAVVSRAHCGVPGAVRNAGMRLAKGQLVQFLDADDLIRDDKFQLQVKLILASDQPDNTVAYSDYVFFRAMPDGTRELERRGPPDGDYWPHDLVAQFSLYTVIHRFLFPTSLIRDVGGFATDLSHAEDLDLWLRLLAADVTFRYHADVMAMYREHVSHSLRNPEGEARCRAIVASRLRGYVATLPTSRDREQQLREIELESGADLIDRGVT